MTKKKSLAWLNCSEEELKSHIQKWIASESTGFKNTIIFLEGEMGAGKSTFARELLSELVVDFSSQGSPTFPLVQEYRARAAFSIYHIDLYRLKNEGELEDSGILHQIEEPTALALVEWPNLFSGVFAYWKDSSRMRAKVVIEVKIENSTTGSDLRNYFIQIV
jgi:tRNA threonylcarbamoyladenosine biosynthesis protein TsaE